MEELEPDTPARDTTKAPEGVPAPPGEYQVLNREPLPPPPRIPPPVPPLALAAGMVPIGCGLIVLLAMAGVVHVQQRNAPWSDALFIVTDSPPWDGVKPAWVRYLTNEDLPETSLLSEEVEQALRTTEDGRLVLDFLRPERHERVVAVDLPVEEFGPLLESGRLPNPGAREVLAGDLTRWDSFSIGGVQFTVVGHIRREASAVLFSYFLPSHENFDDIFRDSSEANRAWLDVHGMSAATLTEVIPEDAEIIGGLIRTPLWIAIMNIFAILLIVCGSAYLHILLFRRLAFRHVPVLHPMFHAAIQWPRLFVAHHVVFFGLFLAVMLLGALMPLMNLRLMNVIQGIFTEGNLKYVGDAYESRNIWLAALATFANNYIHQTLILTLAASVLIPFFGLLKTAASFAFAGFGMAPIWTATLFILPFHSITIVLELEAYILACIAVTLWPIHAITAIRKRDAGAVADGIAIMASAAVLTGILLAVAGAYEATTLILLRG